MRIADAVLQHSRFRPDQTAVTDPKSSYTWAEFARRAGQWGASLEAAGIGRGDRVTMVVSNSAESLALMVGIGGIGAIAVPINPALRDTEMADLMRIAEPDIVICEAACEAATRAALAKLGSEAQLWDIDSRSEHLNDLEPRFDDQLVGEETFTIYFTSGTTGTPKGAYHSQEKTVLDGLMMALTMGMRPDDELYLFLPLFHAGGYHSAQLAFLVGGSVQIRRGFDPDDLASALRGGTSVVIGVPAVWAEFLSQDRGSFPSLRTVYVAGSPATPELLDRMQVAFPNAGIVHAYGLTEGGPFVSALHPDYFREKLGSVGKPLPTTMVALRGLDGSEVPPGEVGEILVKAATNMDGYWNDPEQTEAAFTEGWLRTGDVGKIDEDGYLYVVDRIKEIIISKGENIVPREIELVLSKHPAVADVAVVGLPDDLLEERVVAVVKVRDGMTADEQELIDYVADSIARFKRPREVVFVEEFPRTALKKIAKGQLRAMLISGEITGRDPADNAIQEMPG